jgi:hypothetical protein
MEHHVKSSLPRSLVGLMILARLLLVEFEDGDGNNSGDSSRGEWLAFRLGFCVDVELDFVAV